MNFKQVLSWPDVEETYIHFKYHKLSCLSRVIEQFSAFSAKYLSSKDAEILGSALFELDEISLNRILSSPELYYRLTASEQRARSDSSFYIFISHLIKAEKIRCEMPVASMEPVWTCLGDYCYVHFQNSGWHCQYKSPLIEERIVVDAVSPYASRRSDGTLIQENSDADISKSTMKIKAELFAEQATRALNIVKQISPSTYEFVLTFQKIIVLQRDSENESFSTISGRAFLGKVIFRNSPDSIDPIESLIDTIIHEAIHSYLYIVEQKCPWMENIYDNDLIKSPWSGNYIRIDSYLHACFVWFGLANFWKMAVAFNHEELKNSSKFLDRSLKGFDCEDLTNELGQNKRKINLNILNELRSLPQSIRSGELHLNR